MKYNLGKQWITAIYARVSTEKDNQKSSNDNQISALTEWANNQSNMVIYDTYIDDGISGTQIENRHAFQRMLRDAKSGKINCIIVKSVTRFARNQLDSIRLAKELMEDGVRIIFFQENLDTFDDAKMLGLWSWLAENESRITSERRAIGGREAQKKGRFTTNRPPLGYKTVDGALVIDKDESKIIKRIYSLYIEGNGYSKIAGILNEEGYKTRRNYNFRTDKIKYILRNEVYCGTFIGNRYTKVDMLSKKIIEKPRSEWIILEDNHDAIIHKETFEMVQSLIKDKSFKLGKRSSSLFAGILKCAKCGRGFKISESRRKVRDGVNVHRYYRCSGRAQQGKTFCDGNSIKEEILIELVQRELKLLKSNPETIEKIKEITLSKINEKINSVDTDSVQIEKQISELEKERKELTKKNLKGLVSDEVYKELDEEYAAEIMSLRKRVNKNEFVENLRSFEKKYDDFISTMLKFDNIHNLTNLDMRRLLDCIIIDDDEITINIMINASDFNDDDGLNSIPIVSTIGIKDKPIDDLDKRVIGLGLNENLSKIAIKITTLNRLKEIV